jgi:hypothetical protein
VLRRIFGPKKDEITGEWRKMHNEELHILYSSPNIISDHVKDDEMGRERRRHGGRGMHIGFLWESQKEISTCFHAGFLLGLFLDPEDGGYMFLRNVG